MASDYSRLVTVDWHFFNNTCSWCSMKSVESEEQTKWYEVYVYCIAHTEENAYSSLRTMIMKYPQKHHWWKQKKGLEITKGWLWFSFKAETGKQRDKIMTFLYKIKCLYVLSCGSGRFHSHGFISSLHDYNVHQRSGEWKHQATD